MRKWAYVFMLTLVSVIYTMTAALIPITPPQGGRKLSKEIDPIVIIEENGIVFYEVKTEKDNLGKVNQRELPNRSRQLLLNGGIDYDLFR